MPEGHTLHRLAAQMQLLFADDPWRVSSPQGRFTGGAEMLSAQMPRLAEARGKHLFLHLDTHIWHVHLGLYGAFSFQGEGEFAAVRAIGAPRAAAQHTAFTYDDGGWVIPAPASGAVRARAAAPQGWADLRGPSRCEVLTASEYEHLVGRLGPDPLGQAEELDRGMLSRFARNLSSRRISIAAALLDQSIIAGVGNIYRAESLFMERIDPWTPSRELPESRVASLWKRLTNQLRDGYAEGVIRTFRPGDEAARPGRRHWVYQHQGTPCVRCGEIVQVSELQSRRLYWCPGCQRFPGRRQEQSQDRLL